MMTGVHLPTCVACNVPHLAAQPKLGQDKLLADTRMLKSTCVAEFGCWNASQTVLQNANFMKAAMAVMDDSPRVLRCDIAQY